jgi:hypothetical protein
MLAWVAVPTAVLAGGLITAATDVQPSGTSQGAQVVDVRDRTTRSLEAVCRAEQGAASGWCSAYLLGVADTLTAFGDGGDKGGLCNADYTIEQLPETFLTWAQAHTALLQLDTLAGASLAFREKWPCA